MRVIGSLLVVVVGLMPLVIRGPVFGLFMIVLGVAGYREYLRLAARINRMTIGWYSLVGYAAVAALGCTPVLDTTATQRLLIAFL